MIKTFLKNLNREFTLLNLRHFLRDRLFTIISSVSSSDASPKFLNAFSN
jgi:hypothetical protein